MDGKPRGRFIAIEGIDGSGTTSQTRLLGEWLRRRGFSVLETREPTPGPVGALARKHLGITDVPLDPASLALLFAADRIDHIRREIGPAVAAGVVVLSDRYLLSSLAYQALDCDEAWVREINRYAPVPDLTLLLDVPAEIAAARVAQRAQQVGTVTERFDAVALQQRIAANYRRLAEQSDLGLVVVIDGNREVGTVTAALCAAVATHLEQAGVAPSAGRGLPSPEQ